uniref:Putative secreted protein n=1 Tax=Anopheles marajoara TaxID=58244 RepID=A0A2M4C7D1_9DIPT
MMMRLMMLLLRCCYSVQLCYELWLKGYHQIHHRIGSVRIIRDGVVGIIDGARSRVEWTSSVKPNVCMARPSGSPLDDKLSMDWSTCLGGREMKVIASRLSVFYKSKIKSIAAKKNRLTGAFVLV